MTFDDGLKRRLVYGDLDLTDYPFMVMFEGEEWSSGDLVTTVLSSFLQDGELELSTSRGNMSLSIPIGIEGDDLLFVAQAEALLAAEAQKPTNTLTVYPGDGIAPPTVFDTFRGTPDFNFSPIGEQNGIQRFALNIRALPHARSSDLVATSALAPTPVSPTTAVVDSCSSTTGWTGSPNAVTSVGGTALRETTSGTSTPNLVLTRSGSVTTSVTHYIVVDYLAEQFFTTSATWASLAISLEARADGVLLSPVAQGSGAPGYVQVTYYAPAGSFSSLELRWNLPSFAAGISGRRLTIDNITRTDTRPSYGTGRQQSRQVAVVGTARTQGSLAVSSATAGLGDVLLFTEPGLPSITPALRTYYLSGSGLLSDSTTYSGSYNTMGADTIYSLPGQLLRSGNYLVVARLARPTGAATVTVNWSTQANVGGTAVGRVLSGSRSIAVGTTYSFFPLGTVELPPTGLPSGTSSSVSFAINGATSAVRLDEVYLLNKTTGRISIVQCGTGAPSATVSSRLWLNAATVATGTPTILRGVAADQSDAYYAGSSIVFPGDHEFAPAATKTFLACNATDAEMSLSHYPRWLGHAAS